MEDKGSYDFRLILRVKFIDIDIDNHYDFRIKITTPEQVNIEETLANLNNPVVVP